MDNHNNESQPTIPGDISQEADGAAGSSRGPSRNDIAEAVASRLKSQGETVKIGDHSKRELDHKAKIRKLINEMTASVNYEKAGACLRVSSK